MRVAILGGVALIVFAVLFLRLWSLQILSRTSTGRQQSTTSSAATGSKRRGGRIVDRNGHVIVRNVASTAVVVWPSLLKGSGGHRGACELAKILDIPFWKLRQKIRSHQEDPLTPVRLKVAVSPEVMAYLDEHQSEFPGGPQADLPSLLSGGRAARPGARLCERDLRRAAQAHAQEGYVLGDRIGQSGVEAAFDKVLRGKAGLAGLRVDSLGRPKSELTLTQAPEPGNSVRLTIDISLQGPSAPIQHGIARAHETDAWAANGGSIVATDPNNGDVLAMASYPTFRPSVYTRGDESN